MRAKATIILLLTMLIATACSRGNRPGNPEATKAPYRLTREAGGSSSELRFNTSDETDSTSGSSFKQFSAYLYCPECQEVGMKINVWKSPSREGLETVGSYPHGTMVTVIGNEAGHYKIKKGSVIGYVSTIMIKK